MDPPFTAEQFFEVFRRYNESIWPLQIALTAVGLFALASLCFDTERARRAVALVLAALWAWMAIAFHLAFFRAINPAAIVFALVFLAGALAFLWAGVMRGQLAFRFRRDARSVLGALLIAYAFAGYPSLSWALGHHYPATPTFGTPCPTTLFTIGLLAFVVSPFPRYVLLVPILWTIVGVQAVWLFGVHQDLALIGAGLLGAWIVAPTIAMRRHGSRSPVRG